MRYLGLDVGRRKIGLAAGEMLAEELATLTAHKDHDFYTPTGAERAYTDIAKYCAQEQIDAIVVGLPVSEQGTPTEESKRISKFATGLGEKIDKKIHFTDETLTSFMAEDMLVAQGLSREAIVSREHQLAAQLILQQFLENNV